MVLQKIGLMFLLFLFLLAGCEVSKEEAVMIAKQVFIDNFEQEISPGVVETDQLKLNIPAGVDIIEESDYNLLLQKDGQLYLLFYNPLEDFKSRVNLTRDKEYESEALLFEIIEKQEKLGYIVISPDENDVLKLIVGLGGAKITTLTEFSALEESVQIASDILHSLSYKKDN